MRKFKNYLFPGLLVVLLLLFLLIYLLGPKSDGVRIITEKQPVETQAQPPESHRSQADRPGSEDPADHTQVLCQEVRNENPDH